MRNSHIVLILDIMEKEKKFICARCGLCCTWPGYVRLTTEEVAKIANFLQLSVYSFTEKYTHLTDDRRNLSLIEKEDGSCIFYRSSPAKCIINDVKPAQCKNFPLKWNFDGWEKECQGSFIDE